MARPARHRRFAATIAASAASGVLLVLVGCSGASDGASPSATTATRPATTTTAVRVATTTTEPGTTPSSVPAPAVEPSEVPEGYRPLRAPGIGIGVAVPETWTITDLRGDDLTTAQAEAAATDPQLSALLADGGALMDRARALAAIGPAGDRGTSVVTVIQLDTAVSTISEDLVAQVRQQVEGYGATDVQVARVDVDGLPAGEQALDVRAVLTVDGVPQELATIVVPAQAGVAVLTVRAESAALDSIVRSLAAA